ncbi:PREDICTED: metastasis-suppressor KiSS-1 [Chrysochloris asiatica]|uniref:Metastasis-suppressor KiSS-1 n=1 Tax=Chrysochloris asiatica TaxID=185453 RepID=A0A9B0SZ09_CHRAS|nr:PREDICTED: metastasis-suppressor KiSS-1 [Chrysochloris asiatica]
MNSFVSWQLMLYLCATSFGETSERVVSPEDRQTSGPGLGYLALLAPWEQRCQEKTTATRGPRTRDASLCPPPEGPAAPQRSGLCTPRNRLIPSPRGAVLVQREKDLSAYNWNSFGLRYGKRQLATPGGRGRGAGRA